MDQRVTMTETYLDDIDACSDAKKWFRENFPTGEATVREVLLRAVEDDTSEDPSKNWVDGSGWAAFYFSSLESDGWVGDPADYFFGVRREYLNLHNYDDVSCAEEGARAKLRKEGTLHAINRLCTELETLTKQTAA